MAGFIRRFLVDPGLEELTSIEGVVIIDRDPPAAIAGLANGTVTVVAEFEDGPFDTPTEVTSAVDLLTNFGGFGYEYDGVPSNNVSARSRLADAAIIAEHFNGNGFISVANKRYSRLIVVRPDTSVGEVSFTRLACISGSNDFTWDLEPGQIVDIDIGAGPVTATFDAAAAAMASAAGTYPTTFTGGENLTIVIDEGTDKQVGPVTVYFLAADQTQAQVISRINAALGYTAAVDSGGGVTTISSRIRGTGGSVEITAVSAAAVTTATGLSVSSASGTGDVANIDQVTIAEAKAVIEADVAGTLVQRDENGAIQICNTATPASGTIEVESTTTATAFAFSPLDTTISAATGIDGTIPAGTRVRNAGAVEWVTMQEVDVTASNAGPYTVKIRPAVDDGTIAGAGVGTVTTLPFPVPGLGGFAVTNDLPVTAALSEAAIDAAYVSAIDSTLNQQAISRETNIMFSARQSNAVRTRLRTNAIEASAQGLRGRMAVIRPPLKTTRSQAQSTALQPGVGAYRDQRVIYAFPGAQTFIPQIATRGLAGGTGFTVDGLIDTGFDSWVASVMSQLPPEENPGQQTGFMTGITAIEAGNSDVQNLQINDYKAFKAAGIAALRIDDGVPIIQSGVTSVNPATYPNLKNINRRRMADFIQDTLAQRLKAFNKKLATRLRRALIAGEIEAFMNTLKSENNPSTQRISGYTLDAKSGNTTQTIALGVFRLILKVRTLPSLDTIVLETVVGEAVEINELEEAA